MFQKLVPRMLLLGLSAASFTFIGGCDVDVKDKGQLPDVDVDATPGRAPDVDVRGPEVDVKSEEKTVTVPDVDVKSEEKTITVPDIDVKVPEENENGTTDGTE